MYFVAYLIQGEACEWHMQVVRDVADRFKTPRLYEKALPHITLYRPFTVQSIEPIKEILRTHAETLPWGTVLLNSFGHFDDRVVFAHTEVDNNVRERVSKLQNDLRQVPAIALPHKDWNPHVTIVHRQDPQKIEDIWNYVSTLPKPSFTLSFDHLMIFRYENNIWNVNEIFKTP